MKKLLIVVAILLIGSVPVQAQFGNLVRKAAQKTAEKAAEKAIDNAEQKAEQAMDKGLEEADKAIDKGLDKAFSNDKNSRNTTRGNELTEITYAALMKEALDMPTVQQLVDHKSYELNEQSFKLLTSPVTRYVTNLALLATQAASLSYNNIDSTQAVDMAYGAASSYTGLSREELEKLSKMTEAEQEAYLAARYANGTAEAAMLKEAEVVSKYLEPLQPTIDKWNAVSKKADGFIEEAEGRCKKVYAKYAEGIAVASDKAKNEIRLKYYTEVAPMMREAVQKAMQTRIDEQLPIAEILEKEMVKIRKEHKDYVSQLLNYPQLTATQCFTDASRLTELPEFK